MTHSTWQYEDVAALFNLPFIDLVYQAHTIHRNNFKTDEVQLCTLLSIKTGTCPEGLRLLSHKVAHYETALKKESLWDVEAVIDAAKIAKSQGSTRFCMGAAWRSPPKKDFPKVLAMVREVKALGLETCVTLGMLDSKEALDLKAAGLDYYNHNLDSSPEFYKKIITTRTYEERLETLENVRTSGINVCCGGIIGMGETRQDRIELLLQLANLAEPPKSIPINRLMSVAGTPMAESPPIDNFEFIKMIAVTRIMMPTSFVRLSAGRDTMSEEMHAFLFLWQGLIRFFAGDKLLTTPNPNVVSDAALFAKLGLTTYASPA